jgi:TIGR03009 family protein
MHKPLLIGLTSCWLISMFSSVSWSQTAPRNRTPAKSAPATTRPRTAAPATGKSSTGTATAPQKPARPEPEPLRKLSPELEQILVDWEEKSSKIKRMSGKFKKIVYDDVFAVEQHGEGEFYYEAPDKGAYEVQGIQFAPDAKSATRKDQENKPYKLEALREERWVCTGQTILQITDADRTYQSVDIPLENQGANMIDGPLPFLFGMKAEQAKKRYHLALNPNNKNEKLVWLMVKPKWRQDAENYQLAEVMLDRSTFLPTAVRTVDPTGKKVTVHTFPSRDMNVNPIKLPLVSNALKPNLKGYKQILPAGPAAEQPPARTPASQASGTIPRGAAATLPRSADASAGDSKPPKRTFIPRRN